MITRIWCHNERVRFSDFGESMTHQSFAEASDINTIIRRFQQGVIPATNPPGHYADVSNLNAPLQELASRSSDLINKTNGFFDSYKLPTSDSAPSDVSPSSDGSSTSAAPAD